MPYAEQLPSGKYRAIYRDALGHKRQVKGAFSHKRRAELAAIDAESKSREPGWKDPKASERTWGQWRDEWWQGRDIEQSTLTREATMRVKHIDDYWADKRLCDITRHDIRAWAVGLTRENGLSMSSARRIANILSASLSAAVDAEILDYNPASRLKLTKVEVDVNRYLSPEEADTLLAQHERDPFDFALVSTLFGSGIRWGEVNGLQIPSVNLQRKVIRVRDVFDTRARVLRPYPKGRRIRSVPIPEWTADRLAEVIGGRKTGYVFQREGFVVDYANWRKKSWLPALELSGIGPMRIHDTRHTYASWLIQAGYSLAEIGQLLGHESPSTTQIYAHLLDDVDAKRLHDALPEVGRKL